MELCQITEPSQLVTTWIAKAKIIVEMDQKGLEHDQSFSKQQLKVLILEFWSLAREKAETLSLNLFEMGFNQISNADSVFAQSYMEKYTTLAKRQKTSGLVNYEETKKEIHDDALLGAIN